MAEFIGNFAIRGEPPDRSVLTRGSEPIQGAKNCSLAVQAILTQLYPCSFPSQRCSAAQPGGKPRCCWSARSWPRVSAPWPRPCGSWAAATSATTPATMRCSIGRCGRPVRRPASCWCCLLQHLDRGDGPLVFGIDETLERRRGAKIKARAVYRDPVRSSRQQLVKASGLRWISLMWLGHVPWARRHWVLPVLTVLAPIDAVLPTARTPAQEAHRLGAADGHATAPLAAPADAGAGGRQQLRRAGSAPLLPIPP